MKANDPFNVRLMIPVLLDVEKCQGCEFRFVCWTNRERPVEPLTYELKRGLDGLDEFVATFELSGCASLDSLRLRANQPNFVYIENRVTMTQGYEIVHDSNLEFVRSFGSTDIDPIQGIAETRITVSGVLLR